MLIDGVSRRQLQLLAVAALKAANTIAGQAVFNFASWPTDPKLFPLVMVSAPLERKIGLYPNLLEFNATVTIAVVGRVVGFLEEAVGDMTENLSGQIIDAILLDPDLNAQIQQFTSVETQVVVTAEPKNIIGEAALKFEVTLYQAYGPDAPPLTNVTGTIEPSGTPGGATSIIFSANVGD